LPWKAARICFENQIDFNYIEDHHLGKDAVVGEGGIRIGSMQYGLLVVEEGYGPTVGPEAEAAIAQLAETGRAVIIALSSTKVMSYSWGSFKFSLRGLEANIDMDTNEATPWNPSTELNIAPHGCVVLVWQE
jgi:hypothetical protein